MTGAIIDLAMFLASGSPNSASSMPRRLGSPKPRDEMGKFPSIANRAILISQKQHYRSDARKIYESNIEPLEIKTLGAVVDHPFSTISSRRGGRPFLRGGGETIRTVQVWIDFHEGRVA